MEHQNRLVYYDCIIVDLWTCLDVRTPNYLANQYNCSNQKNCVYGVDNAVWLFRSRRDISAIDDGRINTFVFRSTSFTCFNNSGPALPWCLGLGE